MAKLNTHQTLNESITSHSREKTKARVSKNETIIKSSRSQREQTEAKVDNQKAQFESKIFNTLYGTPAGTTQTVNDLNSQLAAKFGMINNFDAASKLLNNVAHSQLTPEQKVQVRYQLKNASDFAGDPKNYINARRNAETLSKEKGMDNKMLMDATNGLFGMNEQGEVVDSGWQQRATEINMQKAKFEANEAALAGIDQAYQGTMFNKKHVNPQLSNVASTFKMMDKNVRNSAISDARTRYQNALKQKLEMDNSIKEGVDVDVNNDKYMTVQKELEESKSALQEATKKADRAVGIQNALKAVGSIAEDVAEGGRILQRTRINNGM